MTARRIVVVLVLMVVMLLPGSSAQAGQLSSTTTVNYCKPATYVAERCYTMFDGFSAYAGEMALTMAISMLRVVLLAIWLVDRLVLSVFRLAVYGNWLEMFKELVLSNLIGFMPDMLRSVTLGPTGLMYVAMALAGVLMTIPLFSSGMGRLVRPERVMLWGVLLIALFISGTAGYDLISAVENLRVGIVRTILGDQTNTSVSLLVTTPMRASSAEADLTSLDSVLTLPEQFEQTYFPAVSRHQVSITMFESVLTILHTDVETPASKTARMQGAAQALIFSLLSLGGSLLIGLFAWGFVFLGVAALMLILFLMAALPMGFFEFGSMILTAILQRYFQIATLSLAFAVLMRIAAGLVSAALPGTLANFAAVVEWLLILVTLFSSIFMVTNAATRTMWSSFGSFGSALSGSLNIASGGPGVMDTLGRAATGAAIGAVALGGVPGAALGALSAASGAGAIIGAGNRAAPVIGNVFQNNGVPARGARALPEEEDDGFSAPEPAQPRAVVAQPTALFDDAPIESYPTQPLPQPVSGQPMPIPIQADEFAVSLQPQQSQQPHLPQAGALDLNNPNAQRAVRQSQVFVPDSYK